MPPKRANFFDSDGDDSEDDSQARSSRSRVGAGAGAGRTGNAVAGPSRRSSEAATSARSRGGRGGRAPPRLASDRRSAGLTSSSSPSTTTNGNTTFSRFSSVDEGDGDETGMTSFMSDGDDDQEDATQIIAKHNLALDPHHPISAPAHLHLQSDDPNAELDPEQIFAPPTFGPDDNDVKKLMRAWVKERGTVDLMKFEEEIVEDGMHKLDQHAKMLDLLRSDPSTSEEEHFKLMLVATESERVKYLIRGYLRCRIDKIEKYAQHITRTPHMRALLSDIEWDHARRYAHVLEQHFQSSVLNALPEWLRKMDDVGNDGLSMVRKPDKDVPILIHCLRDCGEIVLSDGEVAQLDKESMHLVAYRLVERFVLRGWVEVL